MSRCREDIERSIITPCTTQRVQLRGISTQPRHRTCNCRGTARSGGRFPKSVPASHATSGQGMHSVELVTTCEHSLTQLFQSQHGEPCEIAPLRHGAC